MQIPTDAKRLVMNVFDFANPTADVITVALIPYSEILDGF